MPEREIPAFIPDWSLPAGVSALQTLRGLGQPPYGGFNLGDHVGDDLASVDANRKALAREIAATPVWLNQVHGVAVHEATEHNLGQPVVADAVFTTTPGLACTIMTADCLPVLIADRVGGIVGAAHAGWRGLVSGVLPVLVNQMLQAVALEPEDLSVWLGPAIGPEAFEVGAEVLNAFVALDVRHQAFFKQHPESPEKYLADLPRLAAVSLRRLGITDITLSGLCTVTQPAHWYSYRREGVTGRMASLIWINPSAASGVL